MQHLENAKCPIIYVDDSADDHFLFQHSVRRTGVPFHVQPFFSGEPALSYLRGEHPFGDPEVYPFPVLLLLDYNLGRDRMGGAEIVRRVRAINGCEKMWIVMYSDSDLPHSIAASYQAGAQYFLNKPTPRQRLDELVRSLYRFAIGNDPKELVRLPEYQACPSREVINANWVWRQTA